MPFRLPAIEDEVRVQGTAGMPAPYAALIAACSFCAISLCVDALGWTPSHENAVPNGLALHGWPMSGNARTAVFGCGSVRNESSAPLGVRYAQPCAVACAEMNRL